MADTLHLTHLDACRTAFPDAPIAAGRLLLLGEDNPLSAAPEHALFPYPEGCSGHRLRGILGVHKATYLATWRTNLCVGKWSKGDADTRLIQLFAGDVPWDTVVMLGRKVAGVFAQLHDVPPFGQLRHEVVYMNGPHVGTRRVFQVVSLPHPSGRNAIWNDPHRAADARKLLSEVMPDYPAGEALPPWAGGTPILSRAEARHALAQLDEDAE
jgi:hypothetical protein